jgi:hypothetical protein
MSESLHVAFKVEEELQCRYGKRVLGLGPCRVGKRRDGVRLFDCARLNALRHVDYMYAGCRGAMEVVPSSGLALCTFSQAIMESQT